MPYEAGLPNERLIMKNKKLMLVLLFLMPGTLTLVAQQPGASQAQQASVTSLVSKDLREFPGKEGLMITVDYPPGSVDPIHRQTRQEAVRGSARLGRRGANQLTEPQTNSESVSEITSSN